MKRISLVLILVIILTMPKLSNDINITEIEPTNQNVLSSISENVTSFSTTTQEDIMLLPDYSSDYQTILAYDGPVDYADSHTLDSVTCETSGIDPLYFASAIGNRLDHIYYNLYVTGADSSNVDLYFKGYPTGIVYAEENIGTGAQWLTGNLYDTNIMFPSGYIKLYCDDSLLNSAQIDYAEIVFYIVTSDDDIIIESYSSVDDIDQLGSGSINSDGDIATMSTVPYNAVFFYSDLGTMDLYGYSFEFNIESVSNLYGSFTYYDGSDFIPLKVFTTSGVYKGIFNDSTAENVEWLGFYLQSSPISGTGSTTIDNYRVAPSDKIGWEHNCSSLVSLFQAGGGLLDSSSSDGDKINFTNDAGSSIAEYLSVFIDFSDTQGSLNTSLYPFLELSITDANDYDLDGSIWKLVGYASNGTFATIQDYTDETGTLRYNLLGLGFDDINYLKLYIHLPNDWMILDYLMFYSIANYTLSETDTTISDYLYVSSGVIYSQISTGSFILDNDIPLSLGLYYQWNKSISFGTSYLSFYNSSWSSYTSDTGGNWAETTVTDYRIKFNSSANTINLLFLDANPFWHTIGSSLVFQIDTEGWRDIEDLIFKLFIPVITSDTLEWWFIIIGLILLPASTVYLVYNRKDMSIEKFLIFLIIFFVAWGFIIGGIT